MVPLPEHRALFGLDVIGSASNEGHHLDAVARTMRQALSDALHQSRLAALSWEDTGDGAQLTVSSTRLGDLLDMGARLDTIVGTHNRWYKPEVRLRLAVEVGPVGDGSGMDASKISLARLLDAAVFRQLLKRCMAERADVCTGLIVSDHALRTVFNGDHTRLVKRADFAPVEVEQKEFRGRAWVRVPGVDARSLAGFTGQQPARERPPGPEAPTAGGHVSNTVNGDMHGIQAGNIHGGITFGGGPR